MDDGSAQRDVIPNPFDRSMLWGPSNYDRRHVFVGNLIYELPFLRGRTGVVGSLLGGWQISLLAQLQTGSPFTVGTTDDVAGFGPGNGTGAGNAGNNDVANNSMPSTIYNVTGDPNISRDPKFASVGGTADPNLYFNPAAFVRPAPGTFTTQRNRNLLYNPGFQNWTGALFKRFAITESQSIRFRAEIYNLPNHPNWNNPETNPTSAKFGKVTNKNFERTMQLSLRYEF